MKRGLWLMACMLPLAGCSALRWEALGLEDAPIKTIGPGIYKINQHIDIRDDARKVHLETLHRAENFCRKQSGTVDIQREDIYSESDYEYQLQFRCLKNGMVNPLGLPGQAVPMPEQGN